MNSKNPYEWGTFKHCAWVGQQEALREVVVDTKRRVFERAIVELEAQEASPNPLGVVKKVG
jgi:hypothetical protein